MSEAYQAPELFPANGAADSSDAPPQHLSIAEQTDLDPNQVGRSAAQEEMVDPATTEISLHGPEPELPAWADPLRVIKAGDFIPVFGIVTHSNLEGPSGAKQFIKNAQYNYAKQLNEWKLRAEPDKQAHQLTMVAKARASIHKPADESRPETVQMVPQPPSEPKVVAPMNVRTSQWRARQNLKEVRSEIEPN